jgi:outer membrane immunogenic protein
MKKTALTSLVILTLSGLAYAGTETYSKESKQSVAPPTCPINWTGFYIGAHAGYGFGSETNLDVTPLPSVATFVDLAPTSLDPDLDGFMAGGQMGYNWQFGHFVFGLETDISWTDIDGSQSEIIRNGAGAILAPTNGIDVRQEIEWLGTTRVRLGFTPTCNLLVYGTGGVAYGDVDFSGNTDFRPLGTNQYPASFSDTSVGWVAGGGIEYAINNHWSLKVEYLYHDLGDESITANSVPLSPPFQVRYDWETRVHTVNAGINFKF